MLHKARNYLLQLRSLERINFSLARASATAPLREIDPTRPETWEFSGFSQHGEDGLLDYLTRRLTAPTRYFGLAAATGWRTTPPGWRWHGATPG